MLIKKKRLAKTKRTKVQHIPPQKTETMEAVNKELEKAREEAKKIVRDAKQIFIDSQKKLQEAEFAAQQITQQSIQQAEELKQKTYEETINAANAEAQAIKDQAKKLLNDLFNAKREALGQAHTQILDIALDLAEKIIKYQASIDTEVLKTQVTEAIKRATEEAERVQIFVNSLDVAPLEKCKEDIEKLFPAGLEIMIQVDDKVDQGSCKIETKSGQLDASFKTQLKALVSLVSNIEIAPPKFISNDEVAEEENITENQGNNPVEEEPENHEEELGNSSTAASLFSNFMQGKEVEPLEYVLQETDESNAPQSIDYLKAEDAQIADTTGEQATEAIEETQEQMPQPQEIQEQAINEQPQPQEQIHQPQEAQEQAINEQPQPQAPGIEEEALTPIEETTLNEELLTDKPLVNDEPTNTYPAEEEISPPVQETTQEQPEAVNLSSEENTGFASSDLDLVKQNPLEQLEEELADIEIEEPVATTETPESIEEPSPLVTEQNEDTSIEEPEVQNIEPLEEEEDSNDFQLEYEEDDDDDGDEVEDINVSSILKPKKSTNGISKIAKEVEDNPDFKDLLQDEN